MKTEKAAPHSSLTGGQIAISGFLFQLLRSVEVGIRVYIVFLFRPLLYVLSLPAALTLVLLNRAKARDETALITYLFADPSIFAIHPPPT